MELKPYQQQVINDLSLFLDQLQEIKNTPETFNNFWLNHPRTPLTPQVGSAIEPYKNNIPSVPNVCVKVPTAGGKTFIACNAIKTIFDAFDITKPKAVVWLVPSVTILDQTLNYLKNPSHPYRQKINSLFANRVEVFDKATLLQGSGFNATSVKEQLNIMVFSFDSLRAKNKEDRKVFQENGNLQSFESMLGSAADITLGAVIKQLNPVVIVDESHNAESELSIEMLKELNPSFILDLTATPRKNSNIISFVDALELKVENMVKLPVIVYNHHDRTEVINSSVQLQRKLELQAIEEEKNGGKYIRPIVLFQVQPKNGKDFSDIAEEKTNVERLKEKLIESKIPAEYIKIKTANINEIKGLDLMAKDCEVRYIITINALKEGWDCPFAYILASLADKTSAVDVEQLLGRVLRQPYVAKHNFPLLNVSYVLTASSKFMETLDNIVKALNRAGYSKRDYKVIEEEAVQEATPETTKIQFPLFNNEDTASKGTEEEVLDIDTSRISNPVDINVPPSSNIQDIEKVALTATEELENVVADMNANNTPILPNALNEQVKTFQIKNIFKEDAGIMFPQFYVKVPSSNFFSEGSNELILEKENLLDGFELSKEDKKIDFESISSQLYKIDLDETQNEHTPSFVKVEGKLREGIMPYILDPERKGSRIKNFTNLIVGLIGNMYPIPDKEIEKYVSGILEGFSDEQFNKLGENSLSYKDKIKAKINQLAAKYAEQKFKDWLDTDRILAKPSYQLPSSISPGSMGKAIAKSLYEQEGSMNGFEEKVINELANLESVLFWTRNTERRGFHINGFINHYPDFIIKMKSGRTIILETKGDDRDNSDSEAKIRLGDAWQRKAGNNFKYFMVFENKDVNGAVRLDAFIKKMQEL